RSSLGKCLVTLGRPDEALPHLEIAARLAPTEAIHQWTLSLAARAAGRLGACYLALVDYVRLPDRTRGGKARRMAARRHVRQFETVAEREHPDATPERVARAEEIFARACERLAAGRLDEAVSAFEAVLTLVPSHHSSWG